MIEIECVSLPSFLKPRPEINNKLCYFIQPYDRDGFSVVLQHTDKQVAIKVADLEGKHLDALKLPTVVKEYFDANIHKLLGITSLLRIPRCQLFFVRNGDSSMLVDVYHAGKFAGPGMIQDIFGKQFMTQKVVKIGQYNEEIDKNMIIKPSLFSIVMEDGISKPLYIRS